MSYVEVDEDGTITEYQEESFLVEESGDNSMKIVSKSSDTTATPSVVVLQDEEDIKVYQVVYFSSSRKCLHSVNYLACYEYGGGFVDKQY